MNDAPLPNGWALATLGEVAAETVERSGPVDREFIYVDISSIDRERKCIADAKVLESIAAPSRAKQILQSGDVLVSMTRPNLNAVALVTPEFNGAIGSTGFHVLRSNWVEPKFLFYLVHTREFIEKMCLCVQGALYPAVRPNDLAAYSFSLPPRSEQHRIVAKIEELFSELDQGIENLKTAQAQLKVYRQALLKRAFEGKLTAQWREQNRDQLETAAALQQRIQQERAQRYQQQLAEWENKSPSVPLLQRGKTTSAAAAVPPFVKGGLGGISKPKAPKPLPPLTAEELAELPELPEGWGWVKVGDVSVLGTGVTPLKSRSDFYQNGAIPWVTSGALNENFVSEASDYVTQVALDETNLRLYPKHTLLVALYGEGKTRGKCSELLIEATTNQAIAAIVLEGFAAEIRQYIKWFFQKNYGDIRLKSSGGVQPNLNLGIIENTVFPMCSLAEAKYLVEMLESKLSEVDQLDQTLTTSLQQAEALRQSILKKAFSGQLVPQDPHDEPASKLLARIRAEKPAQPSKKKART